MTTDFPIDRRALIQSVGLLLGATALPAGAFAAPADSAKRFLAERDYALLSAVSDTILPTTDTPGAVAAKVPQTLDAMLANWAAPATLTMVVEALGRIDAAAVAQKQKGFTRLSPDDRAAVLLPHDAAALQPAPPPPGAPTPTFFVRPVYVADQGYYILKDLVLSLYYFSEAATSTELIYEHVPGTYEPSIKLTPQSRPYLGAGLF